MAPAGWHYTAAQQHHPENIPPYLRCAPAPAPGALSAEIRPHTTCDATYWHAMALPLLFYIGWQAAYVLKTEILDAHKLEADPELQTSLRYLANLGKGVLHDSTRSACVSLGVMQRNEKFNPSAWKSKLIFMAAQLLYTCVTLLPTKLMYDHWQAHAGFVIAIAIAAAWNGSGFYIEVFSRNYIVSMQAAIEKTARRQETRITTAVETIISSAAKAAAGAAAAGTLPTASPGGNSAEAAQPASLQQPEGLSPPASPSAMSAPAAWAGLGLPTEPGTATGMRRRSTQPPKASPLRRAVSGTGIEQQPALALPPAAAAEATTPLGGGSPAMQRHETEESAMQALMKGHKTEVADMPGTWRLRVHHRLRHRRLVAGRVQHDAPACLPHACSRGV